MIINRGILKSGGLFLILIAFALPLFGLAITPGDVPTAGDFGVQGVTVESPDKLLKILGKGVQYVYYAFFIVAVLFIILAAYDYLTKSGEPEKIKEVHRKLLYAVVAIVVALLAVGAEAIIIQFLGGKGGGTQLQAPTELKYTPTQQRPYLEVPGIEPPAPQPIERQYKLEGIPQLETQ